MKYNRQILHEILNLSSLTCIQQSVMNFGILMVQDFGNAYSTFIAQNYGAGNTERITDLVGLLYMRANTQRKCADVLTTPAHSA